MREEVYYREVLAEELDRNDVIVRRRVEGEAGVPRAGYGCGAETDRRAAAGVLARNTRTSSHRAALQLPAGLPRARSGMERSWMWRRRACLPTSNIRGRMQPLAATSCCWITDSMQSMKAKFGVCSAPSSQRRWRPSRSALGSGPVPSGYGVHLVLIERRDAGSVASLPTVARAGPSRMEIRPATGGQCALLRQATPALRDHGRATRSGKRGLAVREEQRP